MKTYFSIFLSALLLNGVWEYAHSFLYVHYKSGPITEYILFRAALFDAVVITLCAYIVFSFLKLKYGLSAMAFTLVLFAIGLELWAIEGGRWAYTSAMPIIPIVGVGLTPVIQLGLLGYVSVLISRYVTKN